MGLAYRLVDREKIRAALDLTLPEQVELDELQSCLDERFAWFDAGLLHQLQEMKQAVQHLPTEPPHE